MKVRKRNGSLVDFKIQNIIIAIERAMDDTKLGIDHNLSLEIAEKIDEKIGKMEESFIEVEDIQDTVEFMLMDSPRKDVAKRYIIYRSEKEKVRRKSKVKNKYFMISDEFISKYKHSKSPMEQLGNFVYYRTYSRYIKEEGRREYWWETVRRAVEYNTTIVPTSREEAEKLYDNIFNLRQFLSGRTFWVGNTEVSKKYPMSNYNCAFEVIDSFEAFKDLFYLLMIGSGVGVRVLRKDVAKIPKLRTDYKLIHKDYIPVPKDERQDSTSVIFSNNDSVEIIVGDSKEGWVQALDHFLKLIGNSEYRNIKTIIIDYGNVRPKGERLETFGGTASGHESLKNMFYKIDKVIKRKSILTDKNRIKLSPIDCLDIANIIGENVVVGGVRRTAEMVIIDPKDEEAIEAKSSLYKQVDGKWIVNKELIHRQMSNNSIYYEEKPSREKLKWNIEKMRYSGEPGWINAEAALKRRPNMKGVNPCGEILLDSNGLCNLTTVNVLGFIKEDGTLDEKGLLEAQRLSARAGYRMTCVELELPKWDNVQQRDKLIGCSLTGWQDMVNALDLNKEEEAILLKKLREAAKNAASEYAKELEQNEPLLVTTIKPEGTLSQLPTVSSGVHYSHSPYFIRRVRISADDPLVKVCEELGYPVFPEVGQTVESCTTKVVEFPVKAPLGKTKYDISAIEQLENYKMFMENYVDHNCSITIHVREHEWKDVEEWIWNNWDDVVAVSFLSLDDSFYELLPYEAIDKEEYERRQIKMKPFVPSLISKYEKEEQELDIGTEGCESGVCPIR
ncbi:ribonucleoside-triphosphate reductase, adenosylcobalamin-dependent [Clostridium fallax]|uniref:Adenosylcobalamin-dependent ribonucleoside-triphosphate reductase n=1 Tax=Clostridium fallax TaxID=1533 RepID=A0A1M4WAD0_9CLOT|nr:ribonucleoside-triphosphate reductase, adenosylcobalamin-dependent [Clostridium fallax]SHE78125.1 ribonucleoside-diphosphate reductase alpha chain/ribonucleoside-triphosphate reductase [Clostridium fallax]SQB05929.1 ribonucleoside-triphosphate reductase, adenosylcobalamin-dependent [Clostridium fallax]